jgi:hypothetical protein
VKFPIGGNVVCYTISPQAKADLVRFQDRQL